MTDASPPAAPSAWFTFDGPVALIGGGDAAPPVIAAARSRAIATVAADGGANLFQPGVDRIDAVIGDMDSIAAPEAWRSALGARFLPLAEQDTTDFEKCLYSVAAPLYLAVGVLGPRFDHALAAAHVLLRRRAQRVVLVSSDDVAFLAPMRWRAELEIGDRVSIAPLTPVRAAASDGLRWPVDGLTLAMGDQIGTSNQAAARAVSIDFDAPGALIILPAARLDAAMASLLP